MSSPTRHDSGSASVALRAPCADPESSARAGGGRWSAKRKTAVVLELLRGAELESVSRKHRVTTARLTQWRERFLLAGEAGLKSRESDVADEEKRRLKSALANVSLDCELLREKIARLEDGRPFPWRKSKP